MPVPQLFDRFVVGVDIQQYSARNTREQHYVQDKLNGVLREAALAAGLDRDLWRRQPGGDGECAVLPSDVDLIKVVRRFVIALDEHLTDHNEVHESATRIRLRVAMHSDALSEGPLGLAGPALIVLNRLLDSAPARSALAASPAANLSLIVSEAVYRKVVLSELGGLRAHQFAEVDVRVKEFHELAYVHVPGARSGPPDPDPDPEPRRRPKPEKPSRRRSGSGVTVNGDVHAAGDIVGRDKYGGDRHG